jgi:protein TonB
VKPRRTILPWIYGGSVVAHVAFGAVTATLPSAKTNEAIAITLAEIKKKHEPPKPPPPPLPPPPPKEDKPKPPPPKPAQSQAKIAAETPKDAPPPLELGADGFADLGSVSLGGGGSGGDGVAIAAGPAAAGPAAGVRGAAAPKPTARRVEQLAATVGPVTCNEPVVRPRRRTVVSPKYTMQARQAEIEGVVKIEVTVDEAGRVIAKRVVTGLGYGLDESALKAAQDTPFEPATLCGKPVVGRVILPFRFEST